MIMLAYLIVFSAVGMCSTSTYIPGLNTEVTAYAKKKAKEKAKEEKSSLQPAAPGEIKGTTAKAVNDLNKTLGGVLQVGGVVVVALGIIIILTAFSEQNMQSKMRGAMMIGGGAFLMAIKGVMSVISAGYNDDKKYGAAKAVLGQIGIAMRYVGAIVTVFGLIQVIIAFKDNSSEEKASGTKSLATGIAFLAGNAIMDGVKSLLTTSSSKQGAAALGFVVKYIIARPVKYIGVALVVFGLIQLFTGFKDEDASSKHQGSMLTITGIALVAILSIITSTVGLKGAEYNTIIEQIDSGSTNSGSGSGSSTSTKSGGSGSSSKTSKPNKPNKPNKPGKKGGSGGKKNGSGGKKKGSGGKKTGGDKKNGKIFDK